MQWLHFNKIKLPSIGIETGDTPTSISPSLLSALIQIYIYIIPEFKKKKAQY